jgi:aminodeoxyfutalosine deaminase
MHRSRPLENGFVLIAGNRILQVGDRRDLKFLPNVRLIDLGDMTLLPGLVNAHTHLDFTSCRGRVPFRGNFRDWLTAMHRRTVKMSPADFRTSIREGIRESLAFGTTTLCDVSTSYESYGVLKRSDLRAFVLFETWDIGVPLAVSAWRTALERIKRVTALPPHPATLVWGLSPHSPHIVSGEMFRLIGRYLDQHRRMPTSVHVGESREEWNYFKRGTGPMARRTKLLSPHWPRPRATTPVGALSKLGWLPKLDLAVHCNVVSARDLDLLARHRVAVVHCPGSRRFFGHPRFKYGEFRKKGIRVCLGTDSLASNRSLSMFREMRLFREEHPEARPSETLGMATVRSAQALGLGRELGQVRPGFLADLIGVPAAASATRDMEKAAEGVIAHRGEVPFCMVNGQIQLRIADGG